jgi:tetratricopeptide (TPR) repeat protein
MPLLSRSTGTAREGAGIWRGLIACIVILARFSSLQSAPMQDTPRSGPDTVLRQTVKSLLDAGRLDEAQDQVKLAAAARGETAETLFLAAQILFKQRKFKESIESVKRSLALDPRDPEAYKLLAFNAVVLDRLDWVEMALTTALPLAPRDWAIHFHLGLLYFTTNRFGLAQSEFQKVTQLYPTYMRGYDMLALAQEELESDAVIIETYRKAIELTEQQKLTDESAPLHLAKFLWSRNRYEESLPLARRAIGLNPKSAEAHYVLGRLLDKLGREGEAAKALQESAGLNPNYGEPHYLLSRIYLKQGRTEEARKEMEIFEAISRKVPVDEAKRQ